MTASLTLADLALAAVTHSHVGVDDVLRMAATLDVDPDVRPGAELPLLWHWAFFTPTVPTAALGPDGHPHVSDALAELPRRMWVGGRVRTESPFLVGREATRSTQMVDTVEKLGRSGRMRFVTLEHRITQGGRTVIVEQQDLAYCSHTDAPVAMPAGEASPAAPVGGWSERRLLAPAMLFRFSAATFNAHRIHYDAPYAMTDEGHPALVVHGPLTAMLLAGSAARHDRTGRTFQFRASSPLYAGAPFTILGEGTTTSGTKLTAMRNDGVTAMVAELS